jgi:hypothetical protein
MRLLKVHPIPSFNAGYNKTPRICIISISDGAEPKYLIVEETFNYKQVGTRHEDTNCVVYKDEMYEINLNFKDITRPLLANGRPLRYTASYDESRNEVSLIAGGVIGGNGLPEELKGKHLSTYMMSRIVRWAKEHFPNAGVRQIILAEVDALENNKSRRNRLYEQIGYKFDFGDAECKTGKSKKMSVQEMNDVRSWEDHIKELSADTFIIEMLFNNDIKSYQRGREDGLAEALRAYSSKSFIEKLLFLLFPSFTR